MCGPSEAEQGDQHDHPEADRREPVLGEHPQRLAHGGLPGGHRVGRGPGLGARQDGRGAHRRVNLTRGSRIAVADVGEQRPEHGRRADDHDHPEQHRVVTAHRRVEEQEPHPRVVEDLLGDQRPGEDERQAQPEQRHDRPERVAQQVAEHDPLGRRALRARGADVVLQQVLERRGAHVAREDRHAHQHDRGDRQDQRPAGRAGPGSCRPAAPATAAGASAPRTPRSGSARARTPASSRRRTRGPSARSRSARCAAAPARARAGSPAAPRTAATGPPGAWSSAAAPSSRAATDWFCW